MAVNIKRKSVFDFIKRNGVYYQIDSLSDFSINVCVPFDSVEYISRCVRIDDTHKYGRGFFATEDIPKGLILVHF